MFFVDHFTLCQGLNLDREHLVTGNVSCFILKQLNNVRHFKKHFGVLQKGVFTIISAHLNIFLFIKDFVDLNACFSLL